MDEEKLKQKNQLRGHRSRLKQRFLELSADGLQEYEILELLLTFVLPHRDVKPIAKQLLEKFGSIKNVFDADEEELKQIPFIKDNFVVLVKLIREINALYKKQSIQDIPVLNSIDAIADYCIEKFGYKLDEEFHVIFLNSEYKILSENSFPSKQFHFAGTTDKTVVYPRKIFEEGLKKKAYAMILVHNHPNGVLEASEYDKNLTDLIKIGAKTIGIELIDHLIVTNSGFLSFRQQKLL